MSHTMKIRQSIIETRLGKETTKRDAQFGLIPDRGMTNAIFAVR